MEIARVDLVTERRLGETYRVVAPFGLVALMVVPIALDLQLALISDIAFGIYWALGVLFGLQVALRRLADDAPQRRDLFRLVGVDPAARFVGRVLSGAVLTIGFLLAMAIAAIILFDPALESATWPVLIAASVLVGIGLTQLGTIAGEVATGVGNRSTLASLIIAPLALPLLIGGSQALESVGRETSILPWILLLIACDLALAVAGVALAKPLEEATR